MSNFIQGNSDSQPSTSWPRRLAILACLTVGCVFSFRAMMPDVAAKVTSETSSVAEIRTTAVLPTANDADVKLLTKNIEDVQLGQRVVGRNPLRHETQSPSEIDPATWRAVRLNMIQNGVEFDLAFLRSLSWLKSTGAVVGGSIHMELHELGLNGPARVVGIDPCPIIEPDDGTGRNVVTGTMAHPGANIVYLDITGLDEPLGVTDTHPIWSETRQDFVVAGQLEIGEQFRTVTGQSATLTKIHPHRGPPEMVFNLEVDGQHVYHVAGSGVLVHNTCPPSVVVGGGRAPGFPKPKGETISVNIDAKALPDIVADGRNMPFANGSMNEVFIERIGGEALEGIIDDSSRILSPGGIIGGITGDSGGTNPVRRMLENSGFSNISVMYGFDSSIIVFKATK